MPIYGHADGHADDVRHMPIYGHADDVMDMLWDDDVRPGAVYGRWTRTAPPCLVGALADCIYRYDVLNLKFAIVKVYFLCSTVT